MNSTDKAAYSVLLEDMTVLKQPDKDNRFMASSDLMKQFKKDIEEKKTVVSFAYEDIWYYNNYHVLGHVFVFPHYMKVTFFDADNSFRKLESKGVDFDWYKNDDKDAGNLLS